MKSIPLRVTEDFHAKLKAYVATARISITAYIIGLIEKDLREKGVM